MFGKKKKAGKYRLPFADNEADKPKAKPGGTTNIESDVFGSDEFVDEDEYIDDEMNLQEGMEDVEETAEEEVAASDPGFSNPANAASVDNRYRLLVVDNKQDEKPKTNWEIYYRDREYAQEMGDPLLKVVQAKTREEAESKAAALYGNKGEILAVNSNRPVGGTKKIRNTSNRGGKDLGMA